MQERLQALAQALAPGAQAALVVSEENRRYFTGFSSSAGVLLVSRGGSIFLTDSRYIEAARRAVSGCEVGGADQSLRAAAHAAAGKPG